LSMHKRPTNTRKQTGADIERSWDLVEQICF
jgi:hypothetical protein